MKKIKQIIILLLMLLTLSACGDNEVDKEQPKKEEEKIVKEDILTGTVDGYKFTQVNEVTDRVKIQMSNGDIILVVLSNSDTPKTIENFKNLVEQKFYDGIMEKLS